MRHCRISSFGFCTQFDDNLGHYFIKEILYYAQHLELLVYLNTLITIGDLSNAKEIFDAYIRVHHTRDIHLFLPVAAWAHQLGLLDNSTVLANRVYQTLLHNRKEQILEKMLKGKTVAIVGNAPSALGQNKGQEIDAHDIVIRFNNYRISGYEQDYGRKTSICVKCTADDIDHSLRDEQIELIVYESDFDRHPIIEDYLEALGDTKSPSTFLGFDEHASLRSELGIFPSTGLVLVNRVAQCESRSFLQHIADVYLMLHRLSIFDLSTLEMMNKSKAVILPPSHPSTNKSNKNLF